MQDKGSQESDFKDSQTTLFRFELNRSQTSLFLILSLIGIFMIPSNLAGDVFLNLFSFLFVALPSYLSDPSHYHPDYLIYNFFPIIINIIVYTLLLTLSIYALRRILRHRKTNPNAKRKAINQERIVNWFGLKISHGQSLFIFTVSLVGMIFLVQQFLETLLYPGIGFGFGLLQSLCWIPEGINQATSHEILLENVPLAIMIILFLLCLSSLFIARSGKPMKPSKKVMKNYSLLIFIVSFVLLFLSAARIFCHLALFDPEMASLLGISANAPNQYQNEDFLKTLSFFIICLVLMITSFFLRDINHKERKKFDELSWFRVQLKPHRAVILLSIALLYITFFTHFYLYYIFFMGIAFVGFLSFYLNLIHFIFIPIILFCYYPIGKILYNHRFEKIIENIDNSGEYKTKWFGFNLSKTNSVILLSTSSGLIFLYIFQLFTMNMSAEMFFTDMTPYYFFMIFSFPAMAVVICLILVVIIYTIKKTLPSIKSGHR